MRSPATSLMNAGERESFVRIKGEEHGAQMAPVMCGGSTHADARELNDGAGRSAPPSPSRGIAIRPWTFSLSAGRRSVLRPRTPTDRAWRRKELRTGSPDAVGPQLPRCWAAEQDGSAASVQRRYSLMPGVASIIGGSSVIAVSSFAADVGDRM